jgi:hypothetical protein
VSHQRKTNASPLEVAKAVFWSFLGIRKRSAHESDLARIKPVQVIIAGIVGAILFVVGLILLARFIVSRAS